MPADLTNYILGPANAYMEIQLEDCFWCMIGSGEFTTLSSSQANFKGTITKYQPGPFDLGLTIVDDSNCQVNLNGHVYDATYTTDDENGDHGEIIVTVPQGTISIYQWHSGTRVDASFLHNVWVGQESALRRPSDRA